MFELSWSSYLEAGCACKNDNAQTPLLLLSNTQENESVQNYSSKFRIEDSAREEIKQDLVRLKLQEAIVLRRKFTQSEDEKRSRKNKVLRKSAREEVHDLETKLNFMENKEREDRRRTRKERLRIEAKKAKAKAKKASRDNASL